MGIKKRAEISVSTSRRNEFVDVTEKVRKIVRESGVEDGYVHLYVPHTTAAVTINENYDPSVKSDILNKLSDIVPAGAGYSHSEGNADSHIKASIIGSSDFVPVVDGDIDLGRWQGIFFCEFDGPRSRKMIIQVIE
jgi:secondary thiamine-phosphate synthase enzyme